MSESIKQRTNNLETGDARELRALLEAARVDINTLKTKMAALTAKMDADFADVTNASTDYASSITNGITLTLVE